MTRLNGLIENKRIISEYDIRNKCDDLLQNGEVVTPPVNLQLLAQFACISKIIPTNIKEAGILEPQLDGNAHVFLRKTDSQRRQNFTLAHEIIHTFFPDYQKQPQKRVDPEVGRYYDQQSTIEGLCDFGASYLLMPDKLFIPALEKFGYSSSALQILSDQFDASLEATALRMVATNPERYGVVVWEVGHKPADAPLMVQNSLFGSTDHIPEKKLRVKYGQGLSKVGHFPKHKSLDESSNVIGSSLANGNESSGTETINFNTFTIECIVHALPISNQRRVISLLEVQ